MANVQSTLIQNEAATPSVMNNVGLYGARMRSIVATVENTGTDADTYTICRLLPDWRVLHIWTYNDVSSGSADWNAGLFSDNACATAVDDNCYADAISLATVHYLTAQDLANGGVVATGARTINVLGQRVFEDAGHTAATQLSAYYLGLTGVDAGAASTITVNVEFTVD